MTPEMRAQWLAALSVLSLDEAAEVVRSQLPGTSPKTRPTRNGATDGGKG